MAENDPKLNPETAASSDDPFWLILSRGILAGMELPGIELRPVLRDALHQALPVTMKHEDGIHYLVGLQFDTAGEAENFAKGLEEHCDRDGQRLLFKKRSWQATTQDGQAIWPS